MLQSRMLLLGVILAACASAGPPPVPPSGALIADATPEPIAFRPAQVATKYNEASERGTARLDAPIDAVSDALAEHLDGRSTLVRDARLDRAAAELAVIAQRGEPIGAELLGFALHAHGVIEPVAGVFVSKRASATAVVDELRPQLDAANLPKEGQLGVGGVDSTVVIITRDLPLALSAFPRSIARDGSVDVRGTADERLHDLRGRLKDAEGRVHPLVITRADDGAFHAQLHCDGQDEERWLLLEADPAGTLVQLPIYCGIPVPSVYWIEPRTSSGDEDVARRLTASINRERSRSGLTRLALESRAEPAARHQAEAMRSGTSMERVASEATPADRLRAVGLAVLDVTVTAMNVRDIEAAAETLMNGARSRVQFMDPIVNRVAVGTSRGDDGRLHIAIYYLSAVPRIDPGQFTRMVIDRVKQHGMASKAVDPINWSWESLHVDPVLSRWARTFAEAFALGWTHEAVKQKYRGFIETELGALEWRTITLVDPAKLDEKELVSNSGFNFVAVGVAQSSDAGPMAGRIWVVVFSGCQKHSRASNRRACVRVQPARP